MLIGGQEFPNKCPEDCPGRKEPFTQGGLCHYCPIFNCAGDEDTILLHPKDYRPDWAKAWKEWFDKEMKGFPELRLEKEKETA